MGGSVGVRYARWSEALETGDVEVDSQHRALYDLVNDLSAETMLGERPAAVGAGLDRVLRYASTHFGTEESLMERSAYPRAREHSAIHREFERAVIEMVTSHMAGQGVGMAQLAKFMHDWLDSHIDEHDRPLIEHVRAWRSN